MLAKLTNATLQDHAKDMSELVAGLQSCLALADKLDLAMVGIHIEQACSWLIDHGVEEPLEPRTISGATPDPLH